MCFRQQGLYSPYRPGYTGADCSLRTCPVGKAFDYLSTSISTLSSQVFEAAPSSSAATYASNSKLTAVFIPAAQSPGFKQLRRDQKFWIQIMTVKGDNVTGPAPPYGSFAWRFDEDEYYQPENDVSARAARVAALNEPRARAACA